MALAMELAPKGDLSHKVKAARGLPVGALSCISSATAGVKQYSELIVILKGEGPSFRMRIASRHWVEQSSSWQTLEV